MPTVAFAKTVTFSNLHIRISATADPIASCDTNMCMIPFKRAGNLILIHAKADSTEGDFILDTGAPYLVLNLTYFRDYLVKSEVQGGGITGTTVAQQVSVGGFSMGTFHYANVDADMVSLGHIEDSKGVKVLGLLGVNLFKQFTMYIDYDNNTIRLKCLKPAENFSFVHTVTNDTVKHSTIKFKIVDNKIVVCSSIAGKKLHFVLDTGAESDVMDSRLPNAVLKRVTVRNRVLLTGSGSNKVEALYGSVNTLRIDKYKVQNMPVIVTNLEKMCTAYGYCINGMLGYDFLSNHQIELNFVKEEMYIWN